MTLRRAVHEVVRPDSAAARSRLPKIRFSRVTVTYWNRFRSMLLSASTIVTVAKMTIRTADTWG